MSDDERSLYDDVLELRALLKIVLECPDPKCLICAHCLWAVQRYTLPVDRPVPVIAWTDPIRQYRSTVPPPGRRCANCGVRWTYRHRLCRHCLPGPAPPVLPSPAPVVVDSSSSAPLVGV